MKQRVFLFLTVMMFLGCGSMQAQSKSFATLMNNAKWVSTQYGFRHPDFMAESPEVFVDDIPASVNKWSYNDVTMACWPMIGAWAVDDFPAIGSYLTEKVTIKNITYKNSKGSIFSGYTNDDRIWYMHKCLVHGQDVTHVKALAVIYPKSKQANIKKLINVVKNWR